jgi:hypothetical protein
MNALTLPLDSIVLWSSGVEVEVAVRGPPGESWLRYPFKRILVYVTNRHLVSREPTTWDPQYGGRLIGLLSKTKTINDLDKDRGRMW